MGGSLQVPAGPTCVLYESTKLQLPRARRGKMLGACLLASTQAALGSFSFARARQNGRERRHNV